MSQEKKSRLFYAVLVINSTLLRSETGEAERTIIALRVDGPYIELK